LIEEKQKNNIEEYIQNDETFQSPNDTVERRKNYQKYTNSLKKEVVSAKMRYGFRYTAYRYGVPVSSIKRWLSKNDNFDDLRKNNSRPYDHKLDQKLLNYIMDLRNKKLPVTAYMIQEKAKLLKPDDDFQASL